MILYHSPTNQQLSQDGPTTPSMQRLPALTHTRFSLLRFRSPLLTESQLFSSPMGTEMFHFPTFPPTPLYIQDEVAGHDSGPFEVSLFGHPRIKARLPTPHGLSQVTTSFIGSWCQGIHRPHLVACQKYPKQKNQDKKLIYKDARVHCEILKQRANPNPTHPKTRHMSIWTAPKKRNRIFRTQQRAFWTNPQNPTSHFPLPSQPKDQKKLYSQTKIEPQGF